MLLRIIFWIFSPILAFISLVIIKDTIALLIYTTKYKPQKIPMFYVPWIGLFALFKKTEKRDAFSPVVEILNKRYKDADMVCYSNPRNYSVGMILKDTEIIKEFFVKELDHTVKIPIVEFESEDFGFKSGDHAMMVRGIFNKFFMPENLKNITPKLRKKFDEWMEIIKNEIWVKKKIEKSEFQKVDIRKKMVKIMSSIVNEILFGDKNPPKIDGMTLPEAEEKLLKVLFRDTGTNIFNLLTFGFAHKLGLLKSSREVNKLAKKMGKVCEETIKKRQEFMKSRKEELDCTVLDLLIRHNLESPESEKLTMNEMVSNSIAMIGAGQDTSKNTIEILLYEITRRPNIMKLLVEEEIPKMFLKESDKNDYDSYFKSEYLNSVVLESLRRDSPAPFSFPRLVTKNMKLGKYKIYKGSKIMVSYHSNHMNEEIFKNPEGFDDFRFFGERKKEVKTNTFLPFSGGKRACIGRQLAELVIRMFVCCFFENFEVRRDEGEKEKRTVMRFVKGIEDCVLDIRPRN